MGTLLSGDKAQQIGTVDFGISFIYMARWAFVSIRLDPKDRKGEVN